MPSPGSSARRYAQAVFDIAKEDNTFDTWQEDLSALASAVQEPGFVELLESPRMPIDAKRRMLADVLKGASEQAINLATILVTKSRLGALAAQVSREYERLLDEHRGILRAEVVSAIALDQQQTENLVKQIADASGKEVRLQVRVDPSVVGGLVIRIGDRVLDGSIESRLRGLRRNLIEELA
ncbi:MAG: F0F1 ATP synthase subunit delta [Chloroflexi bacterium]|nr:F0F1 ATP synthase subunit delta [Chloroflexota bacterium]